MKQSSSIFSVKATKKYLSRHLSQYCYLLVMVLSLTACSKSDDDLDLEWREGEFRSSSFYAGACYSAAERFFMRSLFNEVYLWYRDIIDINPNQFSGLSSYFDYLSSDPRDRFSFFTTTSSLDQALGPGIEIGYGMRLVVDSSVEPYVIEVAFVVPGSPADDQSVQRGDQILAVNGFDFSASNRQDAAVGLFPEMSAETHRFSIRRGPTTLPEFNMTSESVQFPVVGNPTVINQAGQTIGYLQFNDHTESAEALLIAAMQSFASADGGNGIDNLILDLRYNGGGRLFIANELSYMIAGATATNNRLFERLVFNDRFADTEIPFFNTSSAGASLPELNLTAANQVIVLSTEETCSASESIINSLRGINVDVVLFGETTCGKPFGFVPTDNCGLTYLPIEFQGVNDQNFGGFENGFAPTCPVSDDLSQPWGDQANDPILAAALDFIAAPGPCPSTATISNSANTAQGPVFSGPAARHPSAFRHNHGLRIVE